MSQALMLLALGAALLVLAWVVVASLTTTTPGLADFRAVPRRVVSARVICPETGAAAPYHTS